MQRGIESVTDVHAVGVRRLQAIVGQAAGAKIYALATNQDSRSVVDFREEKSLSREQTFSIQLLQCQRCTGHCWRNLKNSLAVCAGKGYGH
ncbi:hypothetical protein [Arcanobacterium hippocoleae]|uniref:hypothetical protein n=1 Tax=Arcanobacterium hippocoleae TaxID=149017 RepID=UPI003DA6DCF0